MLLQFHRARESGDRYSFRFEPQDYILPTAGGDSPCARFEWTAEVLADLQAVRLPGRDPEVLQRMGERLRRFVRDAGWAQQEVLISQALAEERPVILTIRSSAAELYALPWELLTLKSGQFLGGVDGLLLRFEWPESPSAEELPQPRAEGGRILLAWSAAAGAVPAAEHVRAIGAACAAGLHPFDPDADVLAHASLERIVQALQAARVGGRPISVLHILCHGASAGSSFGLALNGAVGAAHPVVADAGQLRQQLAPFAKQVRLVVISACDSGNLGALGSQLGSVAQALHRCGFRSVIASRFPLSTAGSISVAERLYGVMLAEPASLEQAFLAARQRLALSETRLPLEQRPLDWASLQLYARHEDGDDTRPLIFRPYRGLLAFQPEHRRFFFGRDAEVAEILADLQALVASTRPRFLVVAAASGTGKSSLVLAGAVPRLQDADPQLVFLRMRPGGDPNRVLDEVLTRWPSGTRAILVVDQFEEIFTHTAEPAVRNAFVLRLWSLASAPEPGLRIVVTLRVDFIGRCGELAVNAAGLRLDRVAYDDAHRVFITQLNPEQLRAVIVQPAHRVGLELQAGLAERMLNEVNHEPGALPLVEDALDVLWQHRSGSLLTQAAYDDLGGVIGALQKRADAILDRLGSPEDLRMCQRLLVSLVAVGEGSALDTRLRVPTLELRAAIGPEQAQGFDRVLHELLAARLLVLDGDGNASTVEVAHEALIRRWSRLRAWLDEDRAGLLMQRRIRHAAQDWDAQGRDDSLLYRGAQLVQAADWRAGWEPRMGPLVRDFLDASSRRQEQVVAAEAQRRRREQEAVEHLAEERRQKERHKLEAAVVLARRTRAAAVVLGVSFLVAAAAGVLALRKSQEARDGLFLTVAQLRKEDPTTVITLLRETTHRYPGLWTQSALNALQAGIAETVVRGGPAEPTALALSADGKKLAFATPDWIVQIRNADGSGAPVVLKGHENLIRAAAFSADGAWLITGSLDHTARISRTDGSGTPIVLRGHSSGVVAVAISPDGKKAATGSLDNTARIWNADGSGTPFLLSGTGHTIFAVAFSPGGEHLVTGSYEGTVMLYSVLGVSPRREIGRHQGAVNAAAFSPDGRYLLTGSQDKTAYIWDPDHIRNPIRLDGHQGPVSVVAISPDGKRLLTGSEDRTVCIWNADGSDGCSRLREHAEAVLAASFTPSGQKIITGSADGTARIWNAEEIGSLPVLRGHSGWVQSVALSPDGKRAITGTTDGIARIWNTDGTGEPVVLKGNANSVFAVAFHPDGRRVATSSIREAYLWNADGSGAPLRLKDDGSVSSLSFSPDGRKLATGSTDGAARIWNTDGSGSPIVLKADGNQIRRVAFSPDGRRLAIGTEGGPVHIWNADGSGAPLLLKGDESASVALGFSPDGKKLLIGASDRVLIRNADGSGSPVVFPGQEITSAMLSPDGRTVAIGSRDKTVHIWDVDRSGAPLVLRGHEQGILSIAFSADGKRLLTGAEDQTARVWFLAAEDLLSAMWRATSDCLPEDQRRELLQESPADARSGYLRCRERAARPR